MRSAAAAAGVSAADIEAVRCEFDAVVGSVAADPEFGAIVGAVAELGLSAADADAQASEASEAAAAADAAQPDPPRG